MRHAILLAVLFATAAPTLAAERVDLFDTQGRRTGYAVIDRDTSRVDYYDTQSRHTGWGKVDSTGRAERFDLQGRRQEGTVLPLEPGDPRRR